MFVSRLLALLAGEFGFFYFFACSFRFFLLSCGEGSERASTYTVQSRPLVLFLLCIRLVFFVFSFSTFRFSFCFLLVMFFVLFFCFFFLFFLSRLSSRHLFYAFPAASAPRALHEHEPSSDFRFRPRNETRNGNELIESVDRFKMDETKSKGNRHDGNC